MTTRDVIDTLAGIAAGSRLDAIRAGRAEARAQSQASYRALFEPAAPGTFPLAERRAVACFVAGLHDRPDLAAFYGNGVAEPLRRAIAAEAEAARVPGPYGRYPTAALAGENVDGPTWRAADRAALGPRLTAALEHAHMLTLHPRDASAAALAALAAARWSADDIVTLSQLVAFLAFQIRVVAGLRVLAETPR